MRDHIRRVGGFKEVLHIFFDSLLFYNISFAADNLLLLRVIASQNYNTQIRKLNKYIVR